MNDPLQIAQAEVMNLIKRHTSPANMLAKAPARLYHYTDAHGLKGILETGKLHATDLRFMNDSGELQYARSMIQKLIPTALSACRDSVRPAFEGALQRIAEVDLWSDLGFYAACFCGERDLLSQWKSYASGGAGYAIGFDTQKLASILDLTRDAGESARAFNEIDYSVSSQETRVRLILDETIACGNRLSAEQDGHPNLPQAFFNIAFGAMAMLVHGLARMKDELFRDEREWRIVETQWKPSRFRVSRAGLLVPFIEFDFGGPEKGAVAELRWGPTSMPGLAKPSLEAYAKFLGYKNLEFEGSKISLRPW